MKKLYNFYKYLLDDRKMLIHIFMRRIGKYWNDKSYLKRLFKHNVGYRLNLKDPKTFNEKLSWLKIYDRNPNYTMMADKYAVKDYVRNLIGGEYVVENYIVAKKWGEIDFASLPEQFVIKCTHDSGGTIVCHSKKTFDFDKAKQRIERNLKDNWFYAGREWPYKNIEPRIIIDKFLDDHTGNELRDYKFWCFGGKPTYMYCTIKGEGVYENFYDMDFNVVPIDHGFPRHKPEFEKPLNFELMKGFAAKLSNSIPFVRVDFFEVEGHVYFGEFTFYDWGGLRPFEGDWDQKLGELIHLPTKNKNC